MTHLLRACVCILVLRSLGRGIDLNLASEVVCSLTSIPKLGVGAGGAVPRRYPNVDVLVAGQLGAFRRFYRVPVGTPKRLVNGGPTKVPPRSLRA